ncbi:MAG: ABC transporter ATP-binding protein [Arenicellales bacterium]|nr:ABC transporter ATP-binding protein [Arenicellales bacterium]
MLQLTSIHVNLGKQSILRGVDLQVEQGELLGLLGPNGAGKSTLLRCILQLIPIAEGDVRLEGSFVHTIPVQERSRKIAYLAQHGPVYWPISVERLVSLGRFPHLSSWQHLSSQDENIVETTLRQTDLWHLRQRTVTTLSGGERTRTLLARALAVDAPLLLADEPVAALDPAHQLQIMDLLRQYSDTGHSVIVVMHDLTLAARYCHRIALMHEGKLIASGTAREVLKAEHLAEVYKIDARYGPDDDFYIIPWRQLEERTLKNSR